MLTLQVLFIDKYIYDGSNLHLWLGHGKYLCHKTLYYQQYLSIKYMYTFSRVIIPSLASYTSVIKHFVGTHSAMLYFKA